MHEPRDPEHKPGDGHRRPEDADNERRDAAQSPGGADGADGADRKDQDGNKKPDKSNDPDRSTDDEIEDGGGPCTCAEAMEEGGPKAREMTNTNNLMGSYVDLFGYSGEPSQ